MEVKRAGSRKSFQPVKIYGGVRRDGERIEGRLKKGETAVIIGAISVGTEIVDAVQMRTI